MGENSGVLGTGVDERPTRAAAEAIVSFGCNGRGGKESHVDVTYRFFSNARQYFPSAM
jgi:hypothetical protein